jgi:repressor LexA
MARDRLTQRQNEAYEFIRGYMDRNSKPPTMQEIGDALGISSTNGVYKLLRALEQKGWIRREKHTARGIELAETERNPFGEDDGGPTLPVVSPTASDQPEELHRRPRGTLSVDPRLLREADDPANCLIGQAGDDGMNGTGIYKGDLLLVEEMEWTDVDNGTLVAVLVKDRLLPREFAFVNGRIHLRPADRHYSEETFPPDHPGCYVIGRLLGLIRTL